LAQWCAQQWPDVFPTPDSPTGCQGLLTGEVSGTSNPQVSEIPDGGCQELLTQQQGTTREKKKTPRLRRVFSLSHEHAAHAAEKKDTGTTATLMDLSPPEKRPKPETQNPFWCPAHGYCHSEPQPDRPAKQCWQSSQQRGNV
jgi:hypothetical protein